MKNNASTEKQKRTTLIYGICVSVLVVLSIIIAITGAANRRGEIGVPDNSDNAASNENSDMQSESESQSDREPNASEFEPPKPSDTSSEDVNQEIVDKLPTFTAPLTGSVSKNYSVDTLVYSVTMNEYRTHSGVDISATVGSEVKAAADGVIGEVWYDPMMGWSVSVIHSGGAVTCYRNLAPEIPSNVKKDAAIKSGDLIGLVGESAIIEIADDAHLHFELAVNGKTVNPEDYITFADKSENYED